MAWSRLSSATSTVWLTVMICITMAPPGAAFQPKFQASHLQQTYGLRSVSIHPRRHGCSAWPVASAASDTSDLRKQLPHTESRSIRETVWHYLLAAFGVRAIGLLSALSVAMAPSGVSAMTARHGMIRFEYNQLFCCYSY